MKRPHPACSRLAYLLQGIRAQREINVPASFQNGLGRALRPWIRPSPMTSQPSSTRINLQSGAVTKPAPMAYYGLPVVGFSARTLVNGMLPCGGGLCLGKLRWRLPAEIHAKDCDDVGSSEKRPRRGGRFVVAIEAVVYACDRLPFCGTAGDELVRGLGQELDETRRWKTRRSSSQAASSYRARARRPAWPETFFSSSPSIVRNISSVILRPSSSVPFGLADPLPQLRGARSPRSRRLPMRLLIGTQPLPPSHEPM